MLHAITLELSFPRQKRGISFYLRCPRTMRQMLAGGLFQLLACGFCALLPAAGLGCTKPKPAYVAPPQRSLTPQWAIASVRKTEQLCRAHPPRHRARQVIYNLPEMRIEPVSWGPQIREKPRTGVPVTLYELSRAVESRRPLLHRCYRWARHADPNLDTTLDLKIVVRCLGNAGTDPSQIEIWPE